MLPTLYLDLDGVLADFEKEMYRMSPDDFDDSSFRDAVEHHAIFEKLDLMPNAKKLIAFVKSLKEVNIEFLTSVGIKDDPEHKARVIKQKSKWLIHKNLFYKPNFVDQMVRKGEYATPYAILVDDTTRAVDSFNSAGGIGILYKDKDVDIAIDKIKKAVYDIKTKISLMY